MYYYRATWNLFQKKACQKWKINLNIFMFIAITEESQPLKPLKGKNI